MEMINDKTSMQTNNDLSDATDGILAVKSMDTPQLEDKSHSEICMKPIDEDVAATPISPTLTHENDHTNPPIKPSWTTLPTEIKELILLHRLYILNRLTWQTHAAHSRRALLPLQLVSHEMRALSTAVWTRENLFCLQYATDDARPGYRKNRMGALFLFPPSHIAAGIRKLDIVFSIQRLNWPAEPQKKPHWNAWQLLLARKNMPHTKYDDTVWQVKMPNIEDLHIHVTLEEGFRYAERGSPTPCLGWGPAVAAFFYNTYTKLRATKVLVCVDGLNCGEFRTDAAQQGKGCRYRCAEQIARNIEQRIGLKR